MTEARHVSAVLAGYLDRIAAVSPENAEHVRKLREVVACNGDPESSTTKTINNRLDIARRKAR